MFITLICFIFFTAFYHLKNLFKLYPYLRKRAISYIFILLVLAVYYNISYSVKFSYILLQVSSGAVILSSIIGLKKHRFSKNENPVQLGSSYVLGGIILQIIGIYVSQKTQTELVQIMLLASVPLIMYGFGFIALENYNKIVFDHMTHIQNKTAELDEAYSALYQTSHYDQQTGLKNLQHFNLDLESAQLGDQYAWAGLINLSNFRKINDALGYQGGDHILKTLSAEIHAFLPLDCTFYRMTGDRFAFIHNEGTQKSTLQICQKIQNQMRTYSITHELPFILTASIGITDITADKTISTMHHELELSMSTASHSSKHKHAVFNQRLLDDFIRKSTFKENLKTATKNEDWSLYFQPQINVNTGRISGTEILIRWEMDDGKIISPGDFIPLAESIGLMKNIGITVIEKSFQTIEKLNSKGYERLQYAINLSGPQFSDQTIFTALCRLKEKHHIPDGQIILEICETVFIENFKEAQELLNEFSACGFKIALDDFGTGYSSLQYLANLTVDEIKFDKSFVTHVDTDLKSKKILATMINLSKQLDIRHVIEGVETADQLRVIQALGGEVYQGYYFSKPVALDSLEHILKIMQISE